MENKPSSRVPLWTLYLMGEKALRCWLSSKLGKRWLEQRSYRVVGKWKNVLARAAIEHGEERAIETRHKLTAKQIREQENRAAVGGLRNPRDAVRRSEELRRTGGRIRRVVEDHMTEKLIQTMCQDCTQGVDREWVLEVRSALAKEFGADSSDTGLQADLWQKLLESAADRDAATLPEWIRNGFPLGIEEEIVNNGIFPATGADSAAVEASRRDGWLQDAIDRTMTNYSSFEEAGYPAEELLQQMEQADRAEVVDTWQQVEALTGGDAKLTRLACIVKQKENGEYKYRLVVDCRRSGVNGLSKVHERVILPKMTDAISSIQSLLEVHHWDSEQELELFSADFKDAFHMLPLCETERKYVVYKNGRSQYHVSKVVVFGLTAGPLLWARLASAAMRLAQATLHKGEGALACYVDDPLLAVMGPNKLARMRTFCVCVAVWLALGLEISWSKVSHGRSIKWIGYEVDLQGYQYGDVVVRLAQPKREKLLQVFEDMLACKGMIPLRLLTYATGVIGWASSVMPATRPWLAMLYAAATQHKQGSSARLKKGWYISSKSTMLLDGFMH